jgi:hypothetical protein
MDNTATISMFVGPAVVLIVYLGTLIRSAVRANTPK